MNKKILASLLVIGVVAAVAGGSTFALFNDTEESSGNTFAAGELDLKVDWEESYNGEPVEEQNLTDNPGPIFDIQDVKPGDYGEATVSLHVYDNPAYVHMNLTQTANFENGCSEPEAEVDDSCGNPGAGEGELGENLYFTVWNDDGDNIRQEDEEVIFNGTAEELDAMGPVQLDGDSETEGIQPFENSTTEYVGISWNVPRDVGNEIQTDSKEFNFTFYAEQARHNEPKDNGTNGEPGEENETLTPVNFQIDLASGEVIENLSADQDRTYGDDLARYAHGVNNESGAVLDPSNIGGSGSAGCVESSEELSVSGDEAHATFTADNCESGQVTYASYLNTGALGWSGGENMVYEDHETLNVTDGEEYNVTIDLPEPQPVP